MDLLNTIETVSPQCGEGEAAADSAPENPVPAAPSASSTVAPLPRTPEDINAYWEELRRQQAEEWVALRARLLNELRLLGAAWFEGEYDAYGDSGEVTSITAFDTEDNEIAMGDEQRRDLDAFVWKTVYGQYPGFENNDGAYGTMTWLMSEDRITVEHSERYTDTRFSSSEL